ncbi:MAG TPA: ribose-5-phosphate isomerase RpiA [Candidatus Dormibacteraeota bacterium]
MEVARQQIEVQKQLAAEQAAALADSGMLVGLGTGSTAHYFIDALAQRVRQGLVVRAVATSIDTKRRAEQGGIPVVDDLETELDLAVDGADEIDPGLNCIKGRGGALLREKIVAHASRRFVLIADESKLVDRLGGVPVPIEILPFLWQATKRSIELLGGRAQLRLSGGEPFRTDNQNYVLDADFPTVDEHLAATLHTIPGVLEHGIFLGMASGALIGLADGTVRRIGKV